MVYQLRTTYIVGTICSLLAGVFTTLMLEHFEIKTLFLIPIVTILIFISMYKKLYIESLVMSVLIGGIAFNGVKLYLLVSILVLLFVIMNVSKIKIDNSTKIFLFYITLILTITIFSTNIINSFSYLIVGLLSFSLFFFCLFELSSFKKIQSTIISISTVLLVVSIMSIVDLLQWNAYYSDGLGMGRLTTLLGRSNAYAGLLTLALPIILMFAVIERKKINKIFYLATIIVLTISLILTASKGGLLTFLIQIILMLALLMLKFNFLKSLKVIITSFGLLTIVFLAFYKYIFDYIVFISARFEGILSTNSTIERVEIWDAALSLFEENIIFGVGFGNFSYVYPEYNHVHNLYLETLVEGGVIGFIPFIGIIFIILFKCTQLINSDNSATSIIGIGFFCSIFGVFFNNAFEPLHSSFLLSGFSYGWFFWLFIAMLFAMSRMKGDINATHDFDNNSKL